MKILIVCVTIKNEAVIGIGLSLLTTANANLTTIYNSAIKNFAFQIAPE